MERGGEERREQRLEFARVSVLASLKKEYKKKSIKEKLFSFEYM